MSIFSSSLLDWYNPLDRPMPWKSEQDPYKIWLSEIILQQTTVAQGWRYYERFIERFPDVKSLASSSEQDVLQLWQGLGYYSRARNLHFAAQQVVNGFKGIMPSTYKDILSLKGVGPYTAAAIASFAYKLSYAVVDGNVKRVVSRYLGIMDAIDLRETHKRIEAFVGIEIMNVKPDVFNQAIMDLGATICTPKKYQCELCPLSHKCVAFRNGLQNQIPFKSKKIKKTKRYFYYLLVKNGKSFYYEQRLKKDIWLNLNQLPLIETKKELSGVDVWMDIVKPRIKIHDTKKIKQQLTHQTIYFKFYEVDYEDIKDKGWLKQYKLLPLSEINSIAFPQTIQKYLTELKISMTAIL